MLCCIHLNDYISHKVPSDVDVRVMLTFLELYQTLLGFVFFKLYTDVSLVYPPPLDVTKEEAAAGVGAFSLQDATHNAVPAPAPKQKTVEVDGKKISSKDVRQTIKTISSTLTTSDGVDVEMPVVESIQEEADEDFVSRPSASHPDDATPALPTLHTLSALPQSQPSKLFAPFVFFLSRESPRPIFEFIVRSFGGSIGWPASSGGGSPYDETNDSITHVIIDRPIVERSNETDDERERRHRRKYVQPQWVVDCINAGKILLEEPYAQGKILPPHLSPFGEQQGAYDPMAVDGDMEDASEAASVVEDEQQEVEDSNEETAKEAKETATLKVAAAATDDIGALRAAELAAEAAGVDYGTFEKEVIKSQKKAKKAQALGAVDAEQDMNKMMMSNKQRKLYEKMKYSQNKRAAEVWPFFLKSQTHVIDHIPFL